MNHLKDAFKRNLKLVCLMKHRDAEMERKYQMDSAILNSPTTSLTNAVTPKKSSVSSLSENIDFDMSHKDKEFDDLLNELRKESK
eukprot:6998902-Ditylum_brightwellii.AAC.1